MGLRLDLDNRLHLSVLWHCWFAHLTCKKPAVNSQVIGCEDRPQNDL